MFGALFEYIASLFYQFFLSGYVSGNYIFPKPLSAQEEREYLKRCKACFLYTSGPTGPCGREPRVRAGLLT